MDETQIVHEYRSRILYFILKQLRDRATAEEITQDVLMVVIEALRHGRIRDESSLGGFIFGVARNLMLNHVRKQHRAGERFSQLRNTETVWKSHPEAELLLRERQAELQRAFDALEDTDRDILQRVFATDDAESVAHELAISMTAMRKRKSRALNRLKQFLLRRSQKVTP